MYRTWLIPYLEETLDAEQRRQIEARLAEDPDLAAEMEALRRAAPSLRRAVAHLRQTEGAAPPAPLWPRLREHLDTRPRRPVRGPVFWWIGGLGAAGTALMAILTLTPKTPPELRDTKLVRELQNAPRLVFHRDNAAGTVVAAKLHTRAVRVALAKRAVNPHVVAVLAKIKPLPVAPPAAPSLPHLRMAGKLPMPVAPPFQMAQREEGESGGPYYAIPAPTHSLPPEGLPENAAGRRLAPGAVTFAPLDGADAPAPRHSPAPTHGQREAARPMSKTDRMVVDGGTVGGFALAPAPLVQNGPNGDALTQNGIAAGAMPMTAKVQAPQAFAGTAASSALGDAAPRRERLERTVTPPLYGTPAGTQELQRLLQSARQEGTLDALTGQIEQGPVDANRAAAQEAVNGRLLAAIYESNADLNRALAERRRVALLTSANGEDWFELAQTEERLGNAASAQRAYAQALHAGGVPLSAAHRAVAHQNLP